MSQPLFINSIEAAVDHVLDSIPGDIVLGIPLAIGKPNPFVNALYRRIKANPARKLKIINLFHGQKLVLGIAFVATLVASINVFGGFAVTQRMLAMFSRS